MNNKKNDRKLTLSLTTMRQLSTEDLHTVNGGFTPSTTKKSYCEIRC